MPTIVVAYTPNEQGEAALERAIEEARLRSARLVVVNATKGEALVDPRYLSDSDAPLLDARLAEAGVEHEIERDLSGDPADIVVDRARELGAELVVIGLRRRTPVGKLVLGSVSQRILLDATVPVLAVHV